ncbi:phage tail protein [Streptococcus suis]|uniref:phage tail protein n=3 Tax=Streptococcus suis TaxID=1307 RepID=UPI002892E6F9|nr:phage tail protein [Streptococcus suis]MDY7595266.1 phage tail protein [Streptococcus suis]MDY7595773.1 phage tail protein [Streptococcus suis]WNF68856.1 phage tail protein [Streptococcus suis]
MLTFLDHKGNEIGALTTFNYTNSVNGERSLSGTVHGNLEIEKGWGVRFEDEYYKVIYAKPKSLGKINIVQFDAVHQFFWDFDKSSVYSELDGSYSFQTFLDHIFNGSGYRYNLEVEVGSLRKQNFGLKKRLELFNDLIKHAGVEFRVRGKVVRILERTGTDLSTVVRKKLNLNDLSIEKRIGDFITYQKGLGAWHDENDHSKGRLEVEYVSPLAAIYGRLEGKPYVDERFTIAENFLAVLKKSVEDSYSISVQLAMEDLQKAGYRYTRPLAGDYITVIDEDINFKERVRIVSFETKYDIKGQVIDHTVTCNDIGSVKKQSAGYSSLKSSVANVSKETESAIQTANRALVSADGKTTVYFGTEFPQDIPKGTLTKGDTLYLEVGDTTKMYYWNGAEWLEPPVVNDVEAFKESINTEIAQVNQSMQAQSEEHDRQVADILSKTQSVESLANQAKSDAASAIARANQVKTEAIADARAQVATVSQALNTAKSELQTAIASADQKARDNQASATALRNDLNLQASKILAQARAQTALTNRVSTVETLADGTRSTVAELSKTVSKATGDITSVTSRTKTVEDTLSQTRTQYEALTQTVNAQTGQIESINRKTADLQSGIDGVTERFESLRIEDNLLLNSSFNQNLNQWQGTGVTIVDGKARITGELNKTKHIYQSIKSQIANDDVSQVYIASISVKVTNYVAGSINPFLALYIDGRKNDSTNTWFGGTYWTANRLDAVNNRGVVQFATTFRINVPRNQIKSLDFYIYARDFTGEVEFEKVSLRRGNIDLGWQASPEDLRSEIATYKRTADEASAELSHQIQLADGKAVDAKTYAQQTATAINTRLESLETYKNAEGARASQYFTASRDETARQVSALRVAVTQDYVAKSVFEETARGISQRFESLYVGGTNLLTGTDEYTEIFNSEQSHAEFLPTPYDLAPVFDKYGLIEYTLSFDLRASQAGQVVVYQQNGSGSKYSGLWKNLTVTTEWQRFHVTFTPTEGTMSLANSYLAFYGTYGTGVKPIIRRVKIERGAIATDWSLALEDQLSYADTKIAEYKTTVDGRFATLQSQKANQVDLQTVRETVNLYERIIGSTETGIKDKVARMVMTDSLFLTEVKDKISGTATQVSQLNNSYAIKNLTSAGTVLNQINLLANGTNRIDGRLTHITGQTLIDNGVIKNAMIGELDAGKITSGTVDAARIKANSIDGSKIAFDEAFFNGLSANQAYLKKLFAKDAFLTAVQAVNLSAKQIAGGIAKALNGGMDVNFDESKINFYTNVAAIRRIYTGHPTQFIKFETEGNYSRTIIGSNRNGGEVFNSATFAGIVVENTNNINTEDNVRLYGDNTLFRHAQGDVGWNINSVTQRIVPANINAESEIWSKHFVAPDKNSKPVRLDTAVAALWDIWNHIIYNNFEFNEALRTHIKARRDNWKFELNL